MVGEVVYNSRGQKLDQRKLAESRALEEATVGRGMIGIGLFERRVKPGETLYPFEQTICEHGAMGVVALVMVKDDVVYGTLLG